MSTTRSNLLTPQLMAQLERLELVTRKIFRGRMPGERRSLRKGQSVEFADFRNYVAGDDLRLLDWNLYARLDKLIIKLFLEEEDLHFYPLLDTSMSMDFGMPSKLEYAQRLAAALGFVGLVRADRVCIETLGQARGARSPVFRGRQHVGRMLERLAALEPGEQVPLAEGVKNFCLRHSGGGVVVLISDLLDKDGYEAALKYFAARHWDCFVVQVFSAEELDPGMPGDLRHVSPASAAIPSNRRTTTPWFRERPLKLVDCEDGEEAEITVSAPLFKRYQQTLHTFTSGIQDYCVRRGMHYVLANNQLPVEDLVASHLRRRGLVR